MLSRSPYHELGNTRSTVSRSSTASGGNFWSRCQYGFQTDIKSSSSLAHLRQGTHIPLAFERPYIQSQPPSRCRGTFPSWLQCTSVISANTAYIGVYSSLQSTIWSADEGSWAPYPENRIADVHVNDIPATCLSDPESMYQTMPPRFTTVCELTIYSSPLI